MNKQQGFTLVELMIVVAIIAILAVIAVPNLIQYTIRAKISEAMTIASAAKASVSEYYTTLGVMPMDNDEAGFDVTVSTDVVDVVIYYQMSPSRAQLEVELKDIGANTGGETIIFEGTGSNQGVTWSCIYGNLADNLRPANCRG